MNKMPTDVSDVRSNPQDQIAHAAMVIGRSKHCKQVFSAIYQGKKKIKTVAEIAKQTSLPRMRVLQEAGKLCNNSIVKKTKMNGDTAYEKDPFYSQNKKKILRLAGNKKALAKFPTKINPQIRNLEVTVVELPKRMVDVEKITIDDIDSFARVKEISLDQNPLPIDEEKFKEGLQKVIGEQGTFEDWGGETDDLFSPRLIIKGERKNVAFGLKGKGQSGILTPKKMGKRGDQIQRLFRSPAEVFLVQYWNQIDESIIEQMRNFAISKSAVEMKKICYGVIDGQDSMRLITAYPECFPEGTVQR
jgi:DNA-binding transcriptional regulator GbsR (MarR family)